jgi:DNA-binding MarR family transcriptional regulator/GNAT superfamily N-acetyltransferase
MQHIDAVRRFNRFYTGRIGVLPEGYLGMPYSLAEARLVYEIAQGDSVTATELGKRLAIDLGYLSRLLQGLKRRGLVQARRAPHDARHALLSLTDKGRKSYAALDARSREKTAGMLAPLGEKQKADLVAALGSVESLLDDSPSRRQKPAITLRTHRPGDLGWVTHRHGVLYYQEYGWDQRFEALVADVVAKFVHNHDPARERCWIAEIDGEPVGSVFAVKLNRHTAKLRLLLIEPGARGLGLGKRLVQQCIDFAREAGYRKLVLWTQSNLAAARHIYKQSGFRRVKQEVHRRFGPRVVGEYWELRL